MKKTVSAGGVVLNGMGKVLVVNQKGRSWSLPKGHVEKGESLLEAAKREIFEESGISELHLVRKLGFYKRHPMGKEGKDDMSEIKSIHMFLFRGEGRLGPRDPENPEAKWVGKGQVEKILTHPKDRKFFRKAREGIF